MKETSWSEMKSNVFPEDWKTVPMPSALVGFVSGFTGRLRALALSESALLAAVSYPWDLQDMFAICFYF